MLKGDLFCNQQRIKISQCPHIITVNQNRICVTFSCYAEISTRGLWLTIETIMCRHCRSLLVINIWITRLHGWPSSRRTHSIFYTPICYFFRREHTYTRANNREREGSKKNSVSLESTVVWSSPASFASRRRERDISLFSRSRMCVRATTRLTWLLPKQYFPSRNRVYALEAQSCPRWRYDLSAVYLANQHSNCRDCLQLRYSRYNRRQYTPIYP